jgi:hypothetical protein
MYTALRADSASTVLLVSLIAGIPPCLVSPPSRHGGGNLRKRQELGYVKQADAARVSAKNETKRNSV